MTTLPPDDLDALQDDFLCGRITEREFRRRMRRLGYLPREIDGVLEQICGA